jgi:hypothetical protein
MTLSARSFAVFLLLLLFALPGFAATTKVEVDLAGPRTLQWPVREGSVFLEIGPLMPGKKYKVADLEDIVVEAVPSTASMSTPLCEATENYVWKMVAAATDEEGVAAALTAAKTAATACKSTSDKALAAIKDIESKLTREAALKGKVSPPLTVDITRDTESWKVFLVKGAAQEPDLLNENEKRMEADNRDTVVECVYTTGKCEDDPLYVNADHISAIVIRGVPTGKGLTVIADPMAPPFENCEVLRQNSISFKAAETPDVVAITLHMYPNPFGINHRTSRRAKGLRLYGWAPGLEALTPPQVAKLCSGEELTNEGTKPTTVEELRTATSNTRGGVRTYGQLKPVEARRIMIRDTGAQIEELSSVPIIADGHSEQVKITFYADGEEPKTFVVPFRYQRFWADAGGAFLFPYINNERLLTEAQADGKVKVVDVKEESSVHPETGIIVNLHPGNHPVVALQFGLSTGGDDSAVSYYLGPALRLREVGRRGLATFSFGGVLTPTRTFPDIVTFNSAKPELGGIYNANDAMLQGRSDYELQWFFGISLGFNFGGVVSGADAVKEMP